MKTWRNMIITAVLLAVIHRLTRLASFDIQMIYTFLLVLFGYPLMMALLGWQAAKSLKKRWFVLCLYGVLLWYLQLLTINYAIAYTLFGLFVMLLTAWYRMDKRGSYGWR